MDRWNDKEKRLLEQLRPFLSTSEIEEVFEILGYDRTYEAVRKQSKALQIKFIDQGEPSTDGLEPQEIAAVNAVLSKRKDRLGMVSVPEFLTSGQKASRSSKITKITQEIKDGLEEIREEVPRKGSLSLIRPSKTGKQSLVCLLSDWHYGLQVMDTEHVVETYNQTIAEERILSIPSYLVSLFSDEALESYDEVVLLMAGDMISGEGVFPSQAWVSEEHAVEQVNRLVRTTWNMVCSLTAIFPLVRIITVRGNHGRTGGSPNANWDNMFYQTLEIMIDLSRAKNITIKNRYGEYGIADIKGWKAMVRHHAPVQADTAAGSNKFASWHMMHEWDIFNYAHWHHWGVHTVNGKPIFRNGSLVGGDEYSEGFGKMDHPTQLIYGVSEKEPCIFVRPLRFT